MTAPTTIGIALTGDFVTTTFNGAISSGASTATIGTGLNIPAANGVLQVDYDSTTPVASDNGPETIQYATYTSGTGALTGLTRGADAYTTGVAHANGATVQAGLSVLHLNNLTDVIENSAWTSYNTAWTGTSSNPAIGDGTIVSRYRESGKTVHFYISLIAGASTTYGTGSYQFTLPITPKQTGNTNQPVYGGAFDTSANTYYPLWGRVDNTTTILRLGASAANPLSPTIPITFAQGDIISISGTYEAA